MLPKEAVLEFIKIHEEETGVKLSLEEASTIAQNFYDGMKVLFKKDSVDKEVYT